MKINHHVPPQKRRERIMAKESLGVHEQLEQMWAILEQMWAILEDLLDTPSMQEHRRSAQQVRELKQAFQAIKSQLAQKTQGPDE